MSNTIFEMAAAGHADDVVDLDLAAGADAQIALDAGVEMTAIAVAAVRAGTRGVALETASFDLQTLDDLPELGSGSCATRSRADR
jgi:hypothetical protein